MKESVFQGRSLLAEKTLQRRITIFDRFSEHLKDLKNVVSHITI